MNPFGLAPIKHDDLERHPALRAELRKKASVGSHPNRALIAEIDRIEKQQQKG